MKTVKISYGDFVKVYEKYQWVKIGRWEGIPNLPHSVFAIAGDKKLWEYFDVPCEPVFYFIVPSLPCYLLWGVAVAVPVTVPEAVPVGQAFR